SVLKRLEYLFFGYIGPNGAGKTTTIKILVGLIRDFEGEVFVDGRSISEERLNIHRRLGYLPQEVGFQEWRTVKQMLTTFGRLSGLSSSETNSRVSEVLETVGLPDVENRKIAHLSGGMKQKLHLAQCLLHHPELLVLDEPMSGLDPASRHQVRSIVRNLAKDGATVLFSSHILSDVQDIASQVGILNNGHLLVVGTPDQIQRHFQLGNDIEIVVADGSPICRGLGELPGIQSIEEASHTRRLLHLKSDADVDMTISSILERLISEGCQLRTFNLVRPSLEEVYLKYVGGL
ncbi:MAG: ABC transporter ATP-binding protein, partial [Candidatus Thorarchaeota archaeon]|nr:ABC transporter ATP-binding protein [Candidatus Thorarchaeota archaeon]